MIMTTSSTLDKLKSEYVTAVVEHMSTDELRKYVRQVIYNTVATESYEGVSQKVIDKFGKDFFDRMIVDIMAG